MVRDAKILIRKPFNEQYTITIDTRVNGVNVDITSTVQLRYDFQVLNISDNSVEVRLLQLDNVLLQANNPMVREVAQVSQVFGRMYNELHLLLDEKGSVLRVLNTDLILSKWKQTKAEMEKFVAGNDDLKQAIILNDEIFTNPEKIKAAVQANEFLRAYFGQAFGIPLPSKTSLQGTNIFNTANLEWSLLVSSSVPLPPVNSFGAISITTQAEPKSGLTSQFYNAAYSQFANAIDITKLNTKLIQQETRIIDYETGRLQEAEISKEEIADEKRLYNKLKYTLKSDSGIFIKPEEKYSQTSVLADDEPKPVTNFRFF